MTCKYCGSANVSAQAKEAKNPIVVGCTLLLGGLGLMFLGLLGAIIGIIIGLLIGVIVKATMPKMYDTVLICRDCGRTSVVKHKK